MSIAGLLKTNDSIKMKSIECHRNQSEVWNKRVGPSLVREEATCRAGPIDRGGTKTPKQASLRLSECSHQEDRIAPTPGSSYSPRHALVTSQRTSPPFCAILATILLPLLIPQPQRRRTWTTTTRPSDSRPRGRRTSATRSLASIETPSRTSSMSLNIKCMLTTHTWSHREPSPEPSPEPVCLSLVLWLVGGGGGVQRIHVPGLWLQRDQLRWGHADHTVGGVPQLPHLHPAGMFLAVGRICIDRGSSGRARKQEGADRESPAINEPDFRVRIWRTVRGGDWEPPSSGMWMLRLFLLRRSRTFRSSIVSTSMWTNSLTCGAWGTPSRAVTWMLMRSSKWLSTMLWRMSLV